MSGIRHPGLLSRLSSEWVRMRDYARTRGIRYGTVKRWAHEGMPILRSSIYGDSAPAVRVLSVLADAWVRRHHGNSVAIKRTSRVYFARRISDGAIKIGFTSDLKRRLKELRKESGAHQLLASAPGTKPDELALHGRFQDARLELEWFRPTPELMAEVHATAESERRAGEAPMRKNEGPQGDATVRGLHDRPKTRRKNSGRAA